MLLREKESPQPKSDISLMAWGTWRVEVLAMWRRAIEDGGGAEGNRMSVGEEDAEDGNDDTAGIGSCFVA